jgi:hypothetical protein
MGYVSWARLGAYMKQNLISGLILATAVTLVACGGQPQSSGTASGITVSPSRATISVGKTVQFQGASTASTAGPVKPTWTSSNSSVATIDSNTGLARSVGVGITTITASIQQSNTQLSGSTTLTVNGALAVQTSKLPQGTVGMAYKATLQAQGGVAPYSWSLSSGSLPAGLSLSSSGVISGTPTSTGTANFVVQVKDSDGSVASASGGTQVASAIQ